MQSTNWANGPGASADSVPARSPYTGSHNILSPAVLDVSPSQQRVRHDKECAKQERTLTSRADTQSKIVLLNKCLWVGEKEGQQQFIELRIVEEGQKYYSGCSGIFGENLTRSIALRSYVM